MQTRQDAIRYFDRRSLEEMVAAINADCGRAAEAHCQLSVLHARRTASMVRRAATIRSLLAPAGAGVMVVRPRGDQQSG